MSFQIEVKELKFDTKESGDVTMLADLEFRNQSCDDLRIVDCRDELIVECQRVARENGFNLTKVDAFDGLFDYGLKLNKGFIVASVTKD